MTHIKKLEDEIVRNGMTFIKMTEEMEKLQHELKLLATDNEKLARENERLQEEATLLKIRHEELIEEANKSSANAHRLLNEVALLTKVAEAADVLAKTATFASVVNMQLVYNLDQALSAWRKWKEKM